MTAEYVVAHLRHLFAQSTLELSLAGLTENERRRNIVFYDEIVPAAIRLRIPASSRTIPTLASDAHITSFSIPLTRKNKSRDRYGGGDRRASVDRFDDNGEEDGSDESGEEETDGRERHSRPPRLLRLLVQSLRVALEAAYVPPRLSRGQAQGATSVASRSTHAVVPSIEDEDAAYQFIPLSSVESNGEAVCMFKEEWAGNAAPPTPSSVLKTKKEINIRGETATSGEQGGAEVWFTTQGSNDEWVVEWRCPLPVVFLRSRHPTPALVLHAGLTLSLRPSILSSLAPSLVPPAKTSASEAVFLHDLLNPLSEGPSYPDESPAERAARADASLAKLPLGKLPSSVLGSKLVTPARGAKEVGRLVEDKVRRNTEDGDMGDNTSLGTVQEFDTVATEDFTAKQVDGEDSKGLGEEMIVVRRSARRALDVRSAILVRMRTTNIACVGEAFGQPSDPAAVEDNLVPTLVLCVEIENPGNSGLKFALDKINVDVSMPSDSAGVLSPYAQVHADAVCIGKEPEPSVLEPATQQNLLYHVRFQLPYTGTTADGIEFDPMGLMRETQRCISIRLTGRPILLRRSLDDTQKREFMPTESFTSTWSCTLDFATQVHALVLQRVVADGAGGYSLGRLRSEDKVGQSNGSIYLQTHPSALPDTLAQRNNQLGRPPNGGNQTEQQLPMGSRASSLSTPRLPLRTAAGATSDAFVSLHRSYDDATVVPGGAGGSTRAEGGAPAVPSRLVGPSILARARQNRAATGVASSTLAAGTTHDDNSLARRSTLVKSPRAPSEKRFGQGTPNGMALSIHHQQRSSNGIGSLEIGRQVLALGTKGSWARMPYLIKSAGTEQGLLIDVTAIKRVPSHSPRNVPSKAHAVHHDDGFPKDSSLQGRCKFDVQLQVDNRSEVTRTLIVRWKTSSAVGQSESSDARTGRVTSGTPASATAVKATSENAAGKVLLLPCEDAVQVGPISAGQSELAMLRLMACMPLQDNASGDGDGDGDAAHVATPDLTILPPLVVLDADSGAERTLTSVQPLDVS